MKLTILLIMLAQLNMILLDQSACAVDNQPNIIVLLADDPADIMHFANLRIPIFALIDLAPSEFMFLFKFETSR